MKLQYLSVIISAMVITSSAGAGELYNKEGNKLDFYGKLNGIHYMSSDDNKNGDRSSIRYGFHGETQLSDGIIGFGTWEHGIKLRHAESENAKNTFTHLGFAGIRFSNTSSIDYGRNYGVLYDIGSWTNVRPEFSGDTTINDNFLSGRANNLLTYRNNNFFGIIDGLNFALQYQGKNDSNNIDNANLHSIQEANGDGYGISVTYDLGNSVSIGTAISSSNRTLSQRFLEQHNNQGKKAEAYAFGLKYDAYDLYLAALYSETRNMTPYGDFSETGLHGFAEKAHNLELVAQYQFDFGLRPSLGYLQSHINGDQNNESHDIKKYIELGASYNLNKNMLTFIDYRINLLPKNEFTRAARISTDNVVALGMTYMF